MLFVEQNRRLAFQRKSLKNIFVSLQVIFLAKLQPNRICQCQINWNLNVEEIFTSVK
jgi:hypothetical protein